MIVTVSTIPAFTASRPRVLFEGHKGFVVGGELSPDDQRLLMIQSVEPEQPATQINVVLNWFEELKKKVPTR